MSLSNIKFFVFTIFLLAIAVSIKLHLNFSWSIGGHDTFQYIKWSQLLFTEDRYLLFFRPTLYAFVLIFHEIFDWSSSAFKIMLFTFWAGSFVLLIVLCRRLGFSKFVILCSILCFSSAPLWMVGDASGHITSIETFFLLSLVLLGINLHKNRSTPNYVLFILTSVIFIFIHEEKILYVFPLVLLIERNLLSTTKTCSIITIIIVAIYFLLGGQSSSENSAILGGGIALSWGNHLFIVHNIFNSLTNAANEFGYFESSVIIIMFITFFVKGVIYILKLFKNERFKFSFSFFNKIFAFGIIPKEIQILILPSILYFLFVPIIFAGIDLPRTTGVVLLPALVGFIYLITKEIDILGTKILRSLFLTLFFTSFIFNLFDSRNQISEFYFEEIKYFNAQQIIENNKIPCNQNSIIGIDNSFDNRPLIWGGMRGYGLESKVYLGEECTIKIDISDLNIAKIIESKNIAAIVVREADGQFNNSDILALDNWLLIHENQVGILVRSN